MSGETSSGVAGWYMDRGGPERVGAAFGEHLRLPLQVRWKVKTALHADREPLTWNGTALLWDKRQELAVDIGSGRRTGTFAPRDLTPEDPGFDPKMRTCPPEENGILTSGIDPRGGFLVAYVYGERRWYARRLPGLLAMTDWPAPPLAKLLAVHPPVMLPGRIVWTAEGPWVGSMDSSSGEKMWLETLPTRVYRASSDGRRVVVGTDEGVACLDAETGALVWRSSVGKTVQYVALADGVGYACMLDVGLAALDLQSGRVIWTTRVEPAGLMTSPCVFGQGVYAGSMVGFYAFSRADGKLLWQAKQTPPYQFAFRTSHPVATEEHIVVGGGAYEYVYVLSRESGEILWAYKTKSMVHSSPVVYRGKVLIGSTDRHYYCFDSAQD